MKDKKFAKKLITHRTRNECDTFKSDLHHILS